MSPRRGGPPHAPRRTPTARRRAPSRTADARRLGGWIRRWSGLPALVWGDFVLDEYWRCRSSRVSREAPVLVLEYGSSTAEGGGAANAALNLAALGARVSVAGWIGADPAGREVRDRLRVAGVDTAGLLTHPDAPTIVKTRIVAGDVHTALQQVVRVDRGQPFRIRAADRARLDGALRNAARGVRAIVLSDYGYDTVTPSLAGARIGRWRRSGVCVGLDARYRLAEYRGVSVATPNETEAAAAAAAASLTAGELEALGARLRRRIRAEVLLVTRGRDGLSAWGPRGARAIPAWGGHEAVDVTGAGDAVVATVTLALAVGAPPFEAAALANVAGSVAVAQRGAVAVRSHELLRALAGEGG